MALPNEFFLNHKSFPFEIKVWSCHVVFSTFRVPGHSIPNNLNGISDMYSRVGSDTYRDEITESIPSDPASASIGTLPILVKTHNIGSLNSLNDCCLRLIVGVVAEDRSLETKVFITEDHLLNAIKPDSGLLSMMWRWRHACSFGRLVCNIAMACSMTYLSQP
jgi:hypothetical protein